MQAPPNRATRGDGHNGLNQVLLVHQACLSEGPACEHVIHVFILRSAKSAQGTQTPPGKWAQHVPLSFAETGKAVFCWEPG